MKNNLSKDVEIVFKIFYRLMLILVLICFYTIACYKHIEQNRENEFTKYEMQALNIKSIDCFCQPVECECVMYLDSYQDYNKKQIEHFIETRYTSQKVKVTFCYE